MYSFARDVITKYHKLSDLNDTSLLSHSLRGYKSGMRVTAKTLKAVGKNVFPASLLPPSSSLTLTWCSPCGSVHLSVQISLLYKNTVILDKGPTWPYLQIKSHSQVLGVRTSTSVGGCNSTQNSKLHNYTFSICSHVFFPLSLLFLFLIPQQSSLRSIFEDKFKKIFFKWGH